MGLGEPLGGLGQLPLEVAEELLAAAGDLGQQVQAGPAGAEDGRGAGHDPLVLGPDPQTLDQGRGVVERVAVVQEDPHAAEHVPVALEDFLEGSGELLGDLRVEGDLVSR